MALHRNIKLLALHNFFTDFVPFAPVAILYFQRITGSLTLGMSIFSIAYGSAAILEVPTGILSDYVGRRKTVILGSVCSVICLILYAASRSYFLLAVGAVFEGASRAFYSGNNDALLRESLGESGKTHEYHIFLGKTSSLFQVALAISAILGGVIANVSFSWVMWISVIPQIGALITAYAFQEPRSSSRASSNVYAHLSEAVSVFFRNEKLRNLNFASVFRFAIGESIWFFRSSFVSLFWPIWAVGIAQALSNIGGAASYYFSGKIIGKYSPLRVLNFEVLFNRILNLTALLFPGVWSPALMSLTSLTFGTGSVALSHLMQEEFTDHQRATMGSINSFAGNIAFALFSVLLGRLGDLAGITNALIISQILLLIPLYFYAKSFRQERGLA